MTSPQAVVFLGPSLDVGAARNILDATYLPPVSQGDVLRLMARPPAVIGIIDGYFELVPSVWHKEILVAMAKGTRVFGAASMGALRAAELAAFGMEGVGQIFDWYRGGVLEDDDEVAVAHGPADSGFVALSVAMVDVRDLCRRAAEEGIVSAEAGERVVGLAKAIFYADRTWPEIGAAALAAGIDQDQVAAMRSFAGRAGEGLKARDARALLERLGEFLIRPWPPAVEPVTPEQTVFLANLQAEVEFRPAAESTSAESTSAEGTPAAETTPAETKPAEATPAGTTPAGTTPAGTTPAGTTPATAPTARTMLRLGESAAVARKKVLLRLLARREAAAVGINVTEDDMQAAADEFRREFGLLTRAEFQTWFAAEEVTDAEWRTFLRDRCVVAQLERLYDHEIAANLPGYLHTATARLWKPHRPPVTGE